MAEWGLNEPENPHNSAPVEGEYIGHKGEPICHVGEASGYHCGVIGNENVALEGTKHLVEDTACSLHGDSGGPYFYFDLETGGILIDGTEVGGPGECTNIPTGGECVYYNGTHKMKEVLNPCKNYYEPIERSLKGLHMELLTEFNEVRTPGSTKKAAKK